jgi:hypothetical protein
MLKVISKNDFELEKLKRYAKGHLEKRIASGKFGKGMLKVIPVFCWLVAFKRLVIDISNRIRP